MNEVEEHSAVADEWEQRHDESSGQVYYVNLRTGESSWEAPGELDVLPTDASASPAHQWTEATDEAGRMYYMNLATMETSWDPPPGYLNTAPEGSTVRPSTAEQMDQLNALLSGGDENDDEEEPAADEPGSSTVTADIAASTVNESTPSETPTGDGSEWMMFLNETDGLPYYYNHITGECVWEPPATFLEYHARVSDEDPSAIVHEGEFHEGSDDATIPRQPTRGEQPPPPQTPFTHIQITPEFEEKVRRAIETVSKTPVGSSRLLFVRTPTVKSLDSSRPNSRPTSSSGASARQRVATARAGADAQVPSSLTDAKAESDSLNSPDSQDNSIQDPPTDPVPLTTPELMDLPPSDEELELLQREAMMRELVLEETALTIQCLMRCFLARQRVMKKRRERQLASEHEHGDSEKPVVGLAELIEIGTREEVSTEPICAEVLLNEVLETTSNRMELLVLQDQSVEENTHEEIMPTLEEVHTQTDSIVMNLVEDIPTLDEVEAQAERTVIEHVEEGVGGDDKASVVAAQDIPRQLDTPEKNIGAPTSPHDEDKEAIRQDLEVELAHPHDSPGMDQSTASSSTDGELYIARGELVSEQDEKVVLEMNRHHEDAGCSHTVGADVNASSPVSELVCADVEDAIVATRAAGPLENEVESSIETQLSISAEENDVESTIDTQLFATAGKNDVESMIETQSSTAEENQVESIVETQLSATTGKSDEIEAMSSPLKIPLEVPSSLITDNEAIHLEQPQLEVRLKSPKPSAGPSAREIRSSRRAEDRPPSRTASTHDPSHPAVDTTSGRLAILNIATFFPPDRRRNRTDPKSSKPARVEPTPSSCGIVRKTVSATHEHGAHPTNTPKTAEQRVQERAVQAEALQMSRALAKAKWLEEVEQCRGVFAAAAKQHAQNADEVITADSARQQCAQEEQQKWLRDQTTKRPPDDHTNDLSLSLWDYTRGEGTSDGVKVRVQAAVEPAVFVRAMMRERLCVIQRVLNRLTVSSSHTNSTDSRFAYWQQVAQNFPLSLEEEGVTIDDPYWARLHAKLEAIATAGHDLSQEITQHRTDSFDSLLHAAAWRGHHKVVAFLVVELRADVNTIDSTLTRTTALHEACRGGHGAVVDVLLSHGAYLDVTDTHGETPLHVACRLGWTEVVHRLIAAGEVGDDADRSTKITAASKESESDRPSGRNLLVLSWPECFSLRNGKHRSAADVASLPSLIEFLTQYSSDLHAHVHDPTTSSASTLEASSYRKGVAVKKKKPKPQLPKSAAKLNLISAR